MLDQPMGLELEMNFPYSYIDIDENITPLYEAFLHNLILESKRRDNLSEQIIKSGISYYYYSLIRIAEQKKIKFYANVPIVVRLKNLISTDYSQTETIEYYADKLNISVAKINNLCKKTVGISAKQYILDLKITEAKRLLIYSNHNINEIAFQLGFEDPSYYARIFKKKTNISPTDFLKKYRKYL